MRLLSVLLCLGSLVLPVHAQNSQPAALVVPVTDVPPFAFTDRQGEHAGYWVTFARLIGEEIGVPIEFLEVANSRELVEAQASGRSNFIPGILKLPPLAATNVFSEEVAIDSLRPAVLETRSDLIQAGVLKGQRIAIVPPAAGSQEPVLSENRVIEYATPQAAMMELFMGQVDAVLLPPPVVFGLATDAGLDGRIRFIGRPLREATRHVALHRSRADLLPEINDVIARLEADGRLETLRRKYNIELPEPPPDILTVAVAHFPPHLILEEDGSVTGFIPEALRDLAERADFEIEFLSKPQADYVKGPDASETDLVAGLVHTDQREAAMDFTLPVRQVGVDAIFTRAPEPPVTKVAELVGFRVGVLAGSIIETIAAGHEALEPVLFSDNETLFQALQDGRVDAALAVSGALQDIAGENDTESEVFVARVTTIDTAIALRFGLGSIRDKINAVLPGYLVSDRYTELRVQYYEEPVFWTRTRVTRTFAAGGVVALLAAGIGLMVNLNTRAKASHEIASVRRELETIFNAATSGIVALGPDGQILRINNRARHFLGALSGEPPMAWPSNIHFLEAETLSPLDDSADPIRRALSGHKLHNQTHMLRRSADDEDQRYVRVDNAALNDPESGIHTVLVIDDVSEEERNRQVIERKSRLDALGQLTGGIAHDFNNLLASQLYSVDLARKAKSNEKRDSYLQVTEDAIKRGKALTGRLLSFARKQPGLSTVRRTQVTLDEFKTLMRPMLEAQVALSVEVEDPNLRHFCDQAQLETALMNLVLNSRDAILRTGKGNRIEIKARPVRAIDAELDNRQNGYAAGPERQPGESFRYVEISVTDNGPGMDEETLARCTDPFFTTKSSTSGTGLGLAMVYGFMRQSDGDLRIYAEPDVGTTVNLTLPRGAEDGLREDRMPDAVIKKGEGQTIFVVEDELELLRMLVDTLADLGYQVISANSGRQALEVLEEGNTFDLLLTDIVMPGGVGGFELAKRMREVRVDLPVVYMSGYTGFTASEMGDVRAPIIQKPASSSELSEVIEATLNPT